MVNNDEHVTINNFDIGFGIWAMATLIESRLKERVSMLHNLGYTDPKFEQYVQMIQDGVNNLKVLSFNTNFNIQEELDDEKDMEKDN